MKLLVRTDASTAVGSVHAMRCLALAQAWQERGGEVRFAMAEGADVLGARLEAERMGLATVLAEVNSAEDARQTLALAEDWLADWLAVDGYRFDADYLRRLKESTAKLLLLDDFGQASFYPVDLVLNQNAHANPSFYPDRLSSTRLLLGLDYALLRREFYRRSQVPYPERPLRHLLLTFGGGDPDNLTGRVLAALREGDSPDLEVCAVVGANNPHRPALEELAGQTGMRTRLLYGVRDMSELYAWADLALSGGGSTLWELAYMGVPALVLILADNQEPSSRLLDRFGSVRCLGRPQQLADEEIVAAVTELSRDAGRRKEMAACGHRLVDGRGGVRVVEEMLAASGQGDL